MRTQFKPIQHQHSMQRTFSQNFVTSHYFSCILQPRQPNFGWFNQTLNFFAVNMDRTWNPPSHILDILQSVSSCPNRVMWPLLYRLVALTTSTSIPSDVARWSTIVSIMKILGNVPIYNRYNYSRLLIQKLWELILTEVNIHGIKKWDISHYVHNHTVLCVCACLHSAVVYIIYTYQEIYRICWWECWSCMAGWQSSS